MISSSTNVVNQRIFNGQLFTTNAKVDTVTLDRVEMIGAADDAKFMIDKFLDNGIGFVKSQNGNQTVQVYKTRDLSGIDLAASLETFGMCKVMKPTPILTDNGQSSRYPAQLNDNTKVPVSIMKNVKF